MSCTDVCVSMDLDGSVDFCHEVWRRAAKPHKCCECARVIVVGESYQHASGKYDGAMYVEKSCAACVEIRQTFCCGSWIYGELWESIRDQLFPSWNEMRAIDCLAKLTTDEAVAKMRAEYAEYVEDQS